MLPSEGAEEGTEGGGEGGAGGGAEVLRRVRDAADCILGEVLQVGEDVIRVAGFRS